MSLDDDTIACARIVEKGDPDRFAAAMAAPVAARAVLFPIYAFNVEVARAPWVTEESLIAEMRLQWWADALDEIITGGPVRRHEVVTPLARVVDAATAGVLKQNIDARRRDARREPIASLSDLRAYLDDTGGVLMWAATRALDGSAEGTEGEPRAREIGGALALANYLLAVPAFLKRGINPLPEMTEDAFAALLKSALVDVARAGSAGSSRALRIAALSAWRAPRILRRALRDPAAVPEGRLNESEILRRASLLWAAARV
ncbi:squalene/phytoene synthase family protein [Thalassococcus sp. CAU 1522]|uniref:Squalene/phytoene synthase family protein n=1 Tax=Thalassococcus arenae TaxID=2851652 RepID=A0ABS6NCF7_9RHOB|nr:squalene/phytoene synthase family protein [Thalassococcus arenae]MBV2361230.1 squalene/phytoene synthase family protein [Thalassococcus arenae]